MPTLSQVSATSLVLVSNATTSRYFDQLNGAWVPRFFNQSSLQDSSSHQFTLTDELGDQIRFWDFNSAVPAAQQGEFISYSDAFGNVLAVKLVSLQKGPGAEQIGGLKGRLAVRELGEECDAQGAFVDSAAVMKNLDLVVCCDTAAAHLAGALGMPVWVAIAAVSDRRWLVGREDTPWYPSLRLFRQRRLHDWDDVFQRMAAALRKKAQE